MALPYITTKQMDDLKNHVAALNGVAEDIIEHGGGGGISYIPAYNIDLRDVELPYDDSYSSIELNVDADAFLQALAEGKSINFIMNDIEDIPDDQYEYPLACRVIQVQYDGEYDGNDGPNPFPVWALMYQIFLDCFPAPDWEDSGIQLWIAGEPNTPHAKLVMWGERGL